MMGRMGFYTAGYLVAAAWLVHEFQGMVQAALSRLS